MAKGKNIATEGQAPAVANTPVIPVEQPLTTPKDVKSTQEFTVRDPQIIKPKELPLVLEPADGEEWLNPEQAEYARTLNGYAYKNPEKWEEKKGVLLKRLLEIGKNPKAINLYRGNNGEDAKLTFKNKTIEN